MKRIIIAACIILISILRTNSHADCNCEDWVKRGGYCVNYVKSRIPIFPVPEDADAITALKNKEVEDIDKGDVAVFNLGRYWHVALVEKVHTDQSGNATAVDVSEMNFGGKISFNDFKNKWRLTTESEWKRAICCGVTEAYNRSTSRQNVEINSITQVWSPEAFTFQNLKSFSGS